MRKHSLFLLLIVWFSACEEEPIPAYVHVPSISVTAKPSEGSASSNITDAWVYSNSNLQGVYELPVEFPILAEGNTRLIVYAGIKLNGISTTRAAYPFYRADTFDISLSAATTDTLLPSVRYSSNAVFDFIENFENSIGFGSMERISGSDVFEGNFSAKILADSSETVASGNTEYAIPYNTSAAFLEMDYKNDHLFEVGIIAIFGTESYSYYKLTVPPRADWNKLYVNFTPEVNTLQAEAYRIYFRVVPEANPADIHIYFDNLKLIHAKV